MSEDFLLTSESARRLYWNCAADHPILDFHSHIPARDIAADRQFANLYELWLEGDHYKWRAMRANGVAEQYCTGPAQPYEKFLAWARTVPYTLRNPLYHWTHLELKRYFGIDELLNESTAKAIWDSVGEQLAGGFTARAILRKFRVEALCTTDDPADDLNHHRDIAFSEMETQVFPTFRPDNALAILDRSKFLMWIEKLRQVSNVDIRNLDTFLTALWKRHEDFHRHGCRLSDHGLPHCYATRCSEKEATAILGKVFDDSHVSADEHEQFASFMMFFFAQLDSEKGWTKQLHLGARRNPNSLSYKKLGGDTGFDTVGDYPQGEALVAYLDLLTRENALPQMVTYNSNPRDTFLFASIAGSFQDGQTPGKIQYGSAWWFLDQRKGITDQIEALSNTGLLSRFIGMVTDSRSFMSFPRHEYFRRVLCDILGRDVMFGDLLDDEGQLSRLVHDVCSRNAKNYLNLPSREAVIHAMASGPDRQPAV